MSLPDYLSEIKPLEDSGLTDEQIAIELKLRHVNDIMATTMQPGQTDLLHVLAARIKAMRLTKDATWQGPLVSYFDSVTEASTAEEQALKQGFELLLTQLQISGRYVYCGTHGPTGALVTGITQVVGALTDADAGIPYTSATVAGEINALTGGVKYPTLITAEIAQVRAAYVQQQLEQSRRNAVLTARVSQKQRADAALAAYDDYYRTADYSQDVDHAAAAQLAGETAWTNFVA